MVLGAGGTGGVRTCAPPDVGGAVGAKAGTLIVVGERRLRAGDAPGGSRAGTARGASEVHDGDVAGDDVSRAEAR